MDTPPAIFQVEKSEGFKTEKGVHLKVTFTNGTSTNFEMDPIVSIDTICAIGRVLDEHRAGKVQDGKLTDSPTEMGGS